VECFIPTHIKIIKDVIFCKSLQHLAYADDIGIIARSRMALPKLRLGDGVTEDAMRLGERNWRKPARNWDRWQKFLKKALAQNGLFCQ